MITRRGYRTFQRARVREARCEATHSVRRQARQLDLERRELLETKALWERVKIETRRLEEEARGRARRRLTGVAIGAVLTLALAVWSVWRML